MIEISCCKNNCLLIIMSKVWGCSNRPPCCCVLTSLNPRKRELFPGVSGWVVLVYDNHCGKETENRKCDKTLYCAGKIYTLYGIIRDKYSVWYTHTFLISICIYSRPELYSSHTDNTNHNLSHTCTSQHLINKLSKWHLVFYLESS